MILKSLINLPLALAVTAVDQVPIVQNGRSLLATVNQIWSAPGTGPFIAADGTALAPTYSFSSDPDTGIFRAAANAVGIAGAGAEQFRITGTASAVNRYSITGGTLGNGPSMSATGADTNIDSFLINKGTGGWRYTNTSGFNYFTISSNGLASPSEYVTMVAGSGGGSAIAFDGTGSNVSALITAKGTGILRFLTGAFSYEQFRVNNITTAVNFFSVQGAAAGGGPVTGSNGSDTNIPVGYVAKGASGHSFYTGGASSWEQVRITSTTSAVNFLQLTGSSTGNTVVESAQGSDTNVAIGMQAKGTSGIGFTTAGGTFTQFRIRGDLSAVNFFDVFGAIAANSPQMRAEGNDTNVPIALSGKGTGGVGLYTGQTSRLQVFVADVASSVNYWQFVGSVSNPIRVTAEGADANVPINFGTKGSGTFDFRTGGNSAVQMTIEHVGSTANWVSHYGNTTTNAPSVRANGTDTNIGLAFMAKGNNSILFYADAGGSLQFQIDRTASAVNYLTITAAVAGVNGPVAVTQGSDANAGIRMYSKGTATISLGTNGGTNQFTVSHAASAVNWVAVQGGATGVGATVYADGETNVGMNVQSKGTGGISMLSGGGGRLMGAFVDVASSVNYPQFSGGATGVEIAIGAQGTDTNVGTRLYSKGTGSIGLYTNNNATLQFAVTHTASAVNWVQATGGATGVTVTLSAQGETNVALTLSPKGSGNLILNPNTGDIRWNKANVALGGGAAPTVGTIGGSGPAAAAQRNWLRFIESDGTASFIPVWR